MTTEAGSRSLRVAARVGAAVLGVVLLIAAWAKAIDPLSFAEQIRAEGLSLGAPAPLLAVLVVALEAGLGSALLLGVRRLWALVPASALVALFVFLNGRAYWRFAHGLIDADESCGCFGNLVARSPAQAFWQDLLLLVPPLALAWLARPRSPGGRRGPAVAAAAALAAGLLAWRAPALPLDDLATRLRPGVRVTEICASGAGEGAVEICLDGLLPELAEGRHLVVIADLEDASTGAAVDRLNALALAGERSVWLVTASPEEARAGFYWQWGPAFEIREAPRPLLRPLYRTLPRSFEVRDGLVEATWPGLPPTAAP